MGLISFFTRSFGILYYQNILIGDFVSWMIQADTYHAKRGERLWNSSFNHSEKEHKSQSEDKDFSKH